MGPHKVCNMRRARMEYIPVATLMMYMYISRGIHSNHAQTASLNIPTLLHRCKTISSWALQEPLAH